VVCTVPVGLFVPAGPGDEVAEPGEILHHLVDDAVVLKLNKEHRVNGSSKNSYRYLLGNRENNRNLFYWYRGVTVKCWEKIGKNFIYWAANFCPHC
jgi:hypothetical protein